MSIAVHCNVNFQILWQEYVRVFKNSEAQPYALTVGPSLKEHRIIFFALFLKTTAWKVFFFFFPMFQRAGVSTCGKTTLT